MVARVFIDAVGNHEPQHCHVTVDGVGTLVDLSDLPGPLSDPLVVSVEWGPFGPNYTAAGKINRRSQNNATSLIEVRPFADFAILGPYLAAYKKRLAEAHGKS
jgi:hypothetical protein